MTAPRPNAHQDPQLALLQASLYRRSTVDKALHPIAKGVEQVLIGNHTLSIAGLCPALNHLPQVPPYHNKLIVSIMPRKLPPL